MPSPATIKIVSGANTWHFPIDGKVRRRRIPWPRATPTSSRQDANTRLYSNTLSITNIVNAFGPYKIDGSDLIDGVSGLNVGAELAAGQLRVLRDSEAETRFGERTLPRLLQNPAINPGATGDVDVAGDGAGAINYHPRPAVFFEGTAVTGVFTWYVDDVAGRAALRWTSGAWADSGDVDAASTPIDVVVHKGAILYLLAEAGVSQIRTSAGGATFLDMANVPNSAATPAAGSRLFNDGNTLWVFFYTTSNNSTVVRKTTDAGASAWSAALATIGGRPRDVGYFYDRDGNSQIVILMENALYWYDQTNNVVEKILDLPFAGRAMAEYGGELLIFMDGGKVLVYKSNGSIRDISPGGTAGMVSGKDFDQDTGGHVCTATSASGVYAFWSGDTVSGADRALILQWRGDGWHYIYRWNAAQQGHAARFIFLDPVSGDLIGAINNTSANADLSTGIQFKDIEVNPRVLGTAAEHETAGYAETPLLTFPPTALTTTMWRIFQNTEKLTATETVQVKYGTNGDAATTTALTAQSSNRTTESFGTGGVGVNLSTVRLQEVYVGPGGANDHLSPYVLNTELSFAKMEGVRYIYIVNIVLEGVQDITLGTTKAIMDNLDSLLAVTTKVTMTYADRSVTVFPIPEEEALETLGTLVTAESTPKSGVWTIYLAEL